MHEEEGDLREPEEEEGDHGVCGYPLIRGDVVGERQEGGPDGAEHDTDCIRAVHGLDGEPEDGEDAAAYDGDIGAPESP